MAGKNAATVAAEDDFDAAAAMLGRGEEASDDFDEADLLNTVDEDDAEGWNPQERGEGLAGRVTKLGETRSDFAAKDEDPMCPTVTVQGAIITAEGSKESGKYRIIGFSSVLKKELVAADPQVGDLIAVKYWGEKPIKRGPFAGKNYRHYSVNVIRKGQPGNQ